MAKSEQKEPPEGMVIALAFGILALLIATGTLKDLVVWFGEAFLSWLWH